MWYGVSEHIAESNLQHPTEAYSEGELIQTADPLNVSLRGLNISESHDFIGNNNDLMVVVKFQFDSQPPIDRLMYLNHNVEPGWYDDFFDDIVLSTNDFSHKKLHIHLQVYDVDNIDQELVDAVTKLVEETASIVTFPLLSEFAGHIDFAANQLVNLVNYINEHDRIIDNKLTLEIDEDPNQGHDLLQPGYLVCLEEGAAIDPAEKGYGLNQDLRLTDADGNEYTESAYTVLEVEREHIQTGSKEIDQKATKLISELRGKGQSKTEAIGYLRDTLRAYDRFKKISRANELMTKESLTESEKELLSRLESDINELDMNNLLREINISSNN
jgi:hypothetical protein